MSLHGKDEAQLPLQTTPQFSVPRVGEEDPVMVQAEKPDTGNPWVPHEKLIKIEERGVSSPVAGGISLNLTETTG